MDFFKRFFGHLKTVLTHKYWVFHYASKFGYFWRGLTHDLSKLSPVEFFESVKYWNGKRSPILAAKEQTGISYAWLHHRGCNKHHYEYWIDKLDEGGVSLKIPFKCVVEMVCDWLAACRVYEGYTNNIFQKEYDWWIKKSKTANIHSETKHLITKILWNLKEYGEHKTETETLAVVRKFMKTWKETYENY